MSNLFPSPRRQGLDDQPDPRLARLVRQVALGGLALVLVWPAARGYSTWLGWMPLWLVAMPMLAWWSLHRFAMPRWQVKMGRKRLARRRPQARRIARTARMRLSSAA